MVLPWFYLKTLKLLCFQTPSKLKGFHKEDPLLFHQTSWSPQHGVYAALSAVGRLDNCIAVCGHCGVMTDRCHDSRATWWWRGCSCWTWTSTGGPAERRRGWDNGVPAFHGPRGFRRRRWRSGTWDVERFDAGERLLPVPAQPALPSSTLPSALSCLAEPLQSREEPFR